jgi:hypothetical protein
VSVGSVGVQIAREPRRVCQAQRARRTRERRGVWRSPSPVPLSRRRRRRRQRLSSTETGGAGKEERSRRGALQSRWPRTPAGTRWKRGTPSKHPSGASGAENSGAIATRRPPLREGRSCCSTLCCSFDHRPPQARLTLLVGGLDHEHAAGRRGRKARARGDALARERLHIGSRRLCVLRGGKEVALWSSAKGGGVFE